MNREKEKVSQMIFDFASGFIDMAESIEEKQAHLDIACTAWNMAVLPRNKMERVFKKYFRHLTKCSIEKKEIKLLKGDVRELIAAKNSLFPDVNRHIVNAKIEPSNGDSYRITAAFLRVEEKESAGDIT